MGGFRRTAFGEDEKQIKMANSSHGFIDHDQGQTRDNVMAKKR